MREQKQTSQEAEHGLHGPFPMYLGTSTELKMKPVQDCLYDTEWYDPRVREEQPSLGFFQRSCGQKSLYPLLDERIKDRQHTNVNQSCMLDYPRRFLVFGFNVFLEEGLSNFDRAEIINTGCVSFIFSGNRELFRRPLIAFPSFRDREEFPRRKEQKPFSEIPMVPFSQGGKKGVLIKPGEAFKMSISFSRKPKTSKPVQLVAVIEGLNYSPTFDDTADRMVDLEAAIAELE